MEEKTVLVEAVGPIGKITFNRPKVLNAYSKDVSEKLKKAIVDLTDDPEVKVVVITGEGKAFMAGADINMVNEWTDLGDAKLIREKLGTMFSPNMLEQCPKPTIAAVNGLAFGMGCEVAMGCDYRIAAESALFALPEIKLGIIPGAGGSQRIIRLVGATKGLEMVSTGDPIDAAKAERIGLVNQVVPAEELWGAVKKFVGRLSDKSPSALAVIKKLTYGGGNLPLYDGVEFEREAFSEILLTEDAAEGTKAFLEKRKPVFQGK